MNEMYDNEAPSRSPRPERLVELFLEIIIKIPRKPQSNDVASVNRSGLQLILSRQVANTIVNELN